MSKKTPAQIRALDFLHSLIKKHERENKPRLPNLERLSEMAGVSPLTMWKAVGRLKNEGILTTSHGHGINISQAKPATEESADFHARVTPELSHHKKQKWETLYNQMEQDILRGIYFPGDVLPAPKMLTRKYGVCYRTLKKTLDGLVEKHFIAPYRKSYRIPVLSSSQSHAKIVLILNGDASGNLQFLTPRAQENLYALENECSKVNVGLEIIPCDILSNRLFNQSKKIPVAENAAGQKSILGYLLWTMGRSHDIADLIRYIARPNLPVALLDETGCNADVRIPDSGCNLKFFAMAYSPLCAKEVGRYLLNLGHREIAFISPFHNNVWARNRLDGLQRIFESAGIKNGVHAVTIDEFSNQQDFLNRVRNAHNAFDLLLTVDLNKLEETRVVRPGALHSLREKMESVVGREAVGIELHRLFEKALAYPDVTAWVAANDDVALECVGFLRSSGHAVPQAISVVGFDNTHEAFLNKLTTYNFNSPAVIRAMLSHILDPKPKQRINEENEPFEIEGLIIERETSANRAA